MLAINIYQVTYFSTKIIKSFQCYFLSLLMKLSCYWNCPTASQLAQIKSLKIRILYQHNVQSIYLLTLLFQKSSVTKGIKFCFIGTNLLLTSICSPTQVNRLSNRMIRKKKISFLLKVWDCQYLLMFTIWSSKPFVYNHLLSIPQNPTFLMIWKTFLWIVFWLQQLLFHS